jgi:hypothetical protein
MYLEIAIEQLEKLLKSLPKNEEEIYRLVKDETKETRSEYGGSKKASNMLVEEVYQELLPFFLSKRRELKREIRELLGWIDFTSPKSETILRIEKEYKTLKEIDKEAQKATKEYFSNHPKERENLTNVRYKEMKKKFYLELEDFYPEKN